MNAFVPYSIPILGLKAGIHKYSFTLDNAFFSHFEASPVEDGLVNVEVQLDKLPDVFVFDFSVKGKVKAICDRCTADINLPVESEGQLLVKYGEAQQEEDDEIVFVERDTATFNIAQYLYEFVLLGLPFILAYDCENDAVPPCNFDVLKYLSQDTDENINPNPIWDSLKNLDN